MTRKGKIARMGAGVREELNRRLHDGEMGKTLIEWLNGLAEVRAVLAREFGGRPIIKQNFSEWKTGGYRDWLAQKEIMAQADRLRSEAKEMEDVTDGRLTDDLGTALAARYAAVMMSWNAGVTTELLQDLRTMSGLCRDIGSLRRADYERGRLELEQKRVEWEREKLMIEDRGWMMAKTGSRKGNRKLDDEAETVAVKPSQAKSNLETVQGTARETQRQVKALSVHRDPNPGGRCPLTPALSPDGGEGESANDVAKESALRKMANSAIALQRGFVQYSALMSGRKQYPFDLIEPKWQVIWEQQQTFRAWNPGDTLPDGHPFAVRHNLAGETVTAEQLPPKYYVLDMFPYPSGDGLHVGHPEGYTATDILARYRRASGYNVLHPMGWDAFGLPAEQYAIKTGKHPRATTETNIANFKRQIKALGFSYDWTREVDTTDPKYFKWTQWIFLKLYNSWFNPRTNKAEKIESLPIPPELKTEEEKRAYRDNKRLAFIGHVPVNWCPELGTVLSNEEVVDGKSEVGGFPVVRRPMRQWMLRITAYAERLLNDLDGIDWSHSLKEMQRNWIGRSEGAEVDFEVADSKQKISVFTTRPDTLFGATYMVLSPEHALVSEITTAEQADEVKAYQQRAAGKSDLERTELAKEKTGVFTGAFAVNPVNQQQIPIWIADYVLATYGTGAIMAVPAHDERDMEFANKFKLPIVEVVRAPEGINSIGFTGDGVSVNSGFISGLPTPEAKHKITAWLDEKGLGKKTINYKLRDWLFSRQRYWGEPFPIIWKNGHHEALPESALPLLPPKLDDYKPTADAQPPLARAKDWVNLPDGSVRETNTMPQWAGSCWYYLRYLDAQNSKAFVGKDAEGYWMGSRRGNEADKSSSTNPPLHVGGYGVDLYVGGAEHAVLHLLYARFWHKVLFDFGYVSTSEPFFKLVNQGLILGEDGQKMSKSRGNVINPDDMVSAFGADSLRLYEMFMGPLEMVKPWNTKGVEGVYRFLGRVWRLFIDEQSETEFEQNLTAQPAAGAEHLAKIQLSAAIKDLEPNPAQLKTLHACIKKVTEDLDAMRFNTGISALMVFINEAMTWEVKPRAVLREFLVLLQPFAPHLAEELFAKLIATAAIRPATLAYQPWPKFDPALLVESTREIPVQVNGKLRDVIVVAADATKEQLEAAALASEKAKPYLEGKTIKKIIVVPGKLVNIAVN